MILLSIAFVIEFKDIIIPILYFKYQKILLLILEILMPLISLTAGIFVYVKYDSNNSIDEGEYKTLELNIPNTIN